MNIAMRRPMTLEQFLAWEDRQELRYEFDGFQPIGMTGGIYAHARIQGNLLRTRRRDHNTAYRRLDTARRNLRRRSARERAGTPFDRSELRKALTQTPASATMPPASAPFP